MMAAAAFFGGLGWMFCRGVEVGGMDYVLRALIPIYRLASSHPGYEVDMKKPGFLAINGVILGFVCIGFMFLTAPAQRAVMDSERAARELVENERAAEKQAKADLEKAAIAASEKVDASETANADGLPLNQPLEETPNAVAAEAETAPTRKRATRTDPVFVEFEFVESPLSESEREKYPDVATFSVTAWFSGNARRKESSTAFLTKHLKQQLAVVPGSVAELAVLKFEPKHCTLHFVAIPQVFQNYKPHLSNFLRGAGMTGADPAQAR